VSSSIRCSSCGIETEELIECFYPKYNTVLYKIPEGWKVFKNNIIDYQSKYYMEIDNGHFERLFLCRDCIIIKNIIE